MAFQALKSECHGPTEIVGETGGLLNEWFVLELQDDRNL
jgi:hypothetical protein